MRNKYMLIGVVGVVAGVLFTSAVMVLAGTNFDSPSVPTDSASQMYTLEQVYDRINDGTAAISMTTFTEPSSGPAATMHDLNAIYDLASERSRPAKTGQTKCYDNSSEQTCPVTGFPGQDGELQKGATWPSTRFTDNGNGTVTDNLTGLIWLKDANCYGGRSWANALSDANALANGTCSLTDGSSAGDWRLPNVNELLSLIHWGVFSPAVPNTAGTGQWAAGDPFDNVQSNYYWSSTTYAGGTTTAWRVGLHAGFVGTETKTGSRYVWPVRGGQ